MTMSDKLRWQSLASGDQKPYGFAVINSSDRRNELTILKFSVQRGLR